MDEVYPSIFPTGRIDYYVENDNRKRVTKTEDRLLKESIAEIESSLRKAGEVHKEVRSYIQSKLRPGLRFWDICCDLEDKVRYLIGENGPNVLFVDGINLRREWDFRQVFLLIILLLTILQIREILVVCTMEM